MPIIVHLDVMLARRKIRSKDLAQKVGLTEANLSLLKNGRVKGVRFATLERLCEALRCQPGAVTIARHASPSPKAWLASDPDPNGSTPASTPTA